MNNEVLSSQQIEYYSRQILLADVGGIGQEKLLGSGVAFLEKNQITEFAAICLVGAGVGKLFFRKGEMNKDCGLQSLLFNRNPDVKIQESQDILCEEASLFVSCLGKSATKFPFISLRNTEKNLTIRLNREPLYDGAVDEKPKKIDTDIALQAGAQIALYALKFILNPGDSSLDKVLLINKNTGELSSGEAR